MSYTSWLAEFYPLPFAGCKTDIEQLQAQRLLFFGFLYDNTKKHDLLPGMLGELIDDSSTATVGRHSWWPTADASLCSTVSTTNPCASCPLGNVVRGVGCTTDAPSFSEPKYVQAPYNSAHNLASPGLYVDYIDYVLSLLSQTSIDDYDYAMGVL